MRTQQQAERAEQQRIKNLVLNYDLREEAESDGRDSNFHYILQPNPNKKQKSSAETTEGVDRQPNPYAQPRLDKGGSNRNHQRARKLQLSDVDWYGKTTSSNTTPAAETLSAAESQRADSASSKNLASYTPRRSARSKRGYTYRIAG